MQSLILKIKGLFTSLNELGEAPEGALLVADNIDLSKDSIAEPRRGFDRVPGGFATPTDRAARTWFYQDKQFAHHGTLGAASTVSYMDSGSWTAVGSFSAPAGTRIRELLSNQNLYWTTAAGVQKLDAYNGTAALAGAYAGLDPQAAITGTSGWLAYNYRTAYRVLWGIKDANGTLVIGTPSQRESIKNGTAILETTGDTASTTSLTNLASTTDLAIGMVIVGTGIPATPTTTITGISGTTVTMSAAATATATGISVAFYSTRNVTVTTTIPDGITTGWFYQLYRAAAVDNTTVETEPSDEMGLVYEGSPTSDEITAKAVTITDIVPDALRGATIYTASSQEGLAYGNERPPLAKDMASFRNCVFYGNTTSKHRYTLTLLSAGGTNGIVADDTVTVGGVTFTAKASEDAVSNEFAVATSGSVSQNIRDTALSLCRVVNRSPSSTTLYARYLSGVDDLPGKILVEERVIGGTAFSLTSSRATCWNPALPTSGTAQSSTNDSFKNGLAWSKQDEPEAVPLPNFVQVGSKDEAILRLVPLRDALYIFKEEGIYKLTGYYPDFTVDLLDSSAKLLAPESCAVLNNQIFCLTDQGVTSVSDGVKIISRPIEQDLLRLYGADLNLVKTLTFGIGYETERTYKLFVIGAAGQTYPTQAFVYNVFTSTWVRHVLNATCGTVSDNRLYLANATSNYMLRDRKSSTYLDYADFLADTTVTATSGSTVTLDAGTDLVEAGDVLYQSSTKFAIITGVDAIASTVTVMSNPGFAAADATLLKAIACDIQWVPVTTGNAGITKQFHTTSLLFKADFSGTGYLTFTSDLSPFDESVPISGTGIAAWGLTSWGSGPWGGKALKRPVRQWVPRAKQRSSQLTVSFQHAYGFSSWQLQGITLFGTPGSDRVAV